MSKSKPYMFFCNKVQKNHMHELLNGYKAMFKRVKFRTKTSLKSLKISSH